MVVCRPNQTKKALVYLPASLIYENKRLKTDSDFKIPKELSEVLGKPHFWHSAGQAQIIHDPICKGLGVCQAYFAKMATAFDDLLFVRIHIKEAQSLNESD